MAVRGLHNAEGRLLAVMGDTLYRVSNAGVAIPLGDIPGTGRVQIDHNQISLGNEVLAVNGSAGYLWNSVTDVFTRVTDTGFPGGSSVRFIDGYFVVIEPQGRFAQNSRPAQGLEWNTLDRWTSEVSPDPLTAQEVVRNDLLLFSTTSGEFFQSTTNSQQPFRTKRISFKVGCPGPHCVTEADSTAFWLGSDGVFYTLNGYSPLRISTRPIEDSIAGLDWARCFAYRWDTVIYWTFPDGLTWGYDFAQKRWHRRESYGLDRWRVNAMAWWNDGWVAGDFQDNRLWHCNLSDRYWLEGATPYSTRFTQGVIHDNQNKVRIPRLELVMDTGQPVTAPVAFPAQPNAPTISGDAPNAYVGDVYNFAYTLASGTPPYTVTLRSGTLPAGMTLSPAGVLSGTLTAAADVDIVVRVTDDNDLYDDHADSIEVLSNLPTLATNSRHYFGAGDNLQAGSAAVGWSNIISTIAISPSGRYLAGSIFDSVVGFVWYKFDPTTEVWSLLSPPAFNADEVTSLTWHPSGNYLCVTRSSNSTDNMSIYRRTGDTLAAITNPAGLGAVTVHHLAWSADGLRLFGARGNSTEQFFVVDFSPVTGAFGTVTLFGSSGDGTGELCELHPDGEFMVGVTTDGGNGSVVVWDISGTPTRISALSIADAHCARFDASGTRLVVASYNGPTFLVQLAMSASGVLSLTGAAIAQPANVTHRTDSMATNPDRTILAVADGTNYFARLYDTSAPSAVTVMTNPPSTVSEAIQCVSWSEVGYE